MRNRFAEYRAVYVNPKGFSIQKHFRTEASMDSWLARHAATVTVRSGPVSA